MSTSYKGGCHCGAVRYSTTTDLSNAIACNCSICSKSGIWLTFVQTTDFTLESGEENLQDYQFNKKHIHHLFCKTCGVHSFCRGKDGKGNEMVAINIRCLDGIDTNELHPKPFNGKDS